MNSPPHILCINPWIHDFAAYDVWAKPYGLLSLAAIVRHHGYRVSYMDCLDRFHPRMPRTNPFARNGRGPYKKTAIDKPPGLEDINRTYSRYGIDPEWFRRDLQALSPPDLILVTSMMTYWAPGVRETISIVKEIYPKTPVMLGGIYATLCYDHACRYSGADLVVKGNGEKVILDILSDFLDHREPIRYQPDDPDTYPYPAYDLQHVINYVPILSSRGCPYSCAYCASKYLTPAYVRRSPEMVAAEVKHFHTRHGVKDFVFYDDALLIDARNYAIPILNHIIDANLDIRFHLPNALHIREINEETARLMFQAGFKTLRLGLETTEFDDHRRHLDRKVNEAEFHRAIRVLLETGFSPQQIGAYLLFGLPGQTMAAMEHSIRTVLKSNITPILAHYTPIPHTAMWKEAVDASRYDIEADPVFTNNAILPCRREPFSWDPITRLKRIITEKKQ